MRPGCPTPVPVGSVGSMTGGDVGGPGACLVVEDEPAIARLLQVELGASGFEVRLAADGTEALAAVAEEVPDVVIADVMMPRMGGFELVRRLREDPRTEDVSIIMLTARGLKADKLEGLTAGADDYLTKPFDNEELVTRVRGVIRRARYMRSQSPLTGLPGNLRIEDEIEGEGRDRGALRPPVRGPRPLQGVQRPLRVRAGRRGAAGDRRARARVGTPGRRRRLVRRPHRRRRFRRARGSRPDRGRRVGDLREVRRGRPGAGTTRRTPSADRSTPRTATAPPAATRSSRCRSAPPPRPCGRSLTGPRPSPSRPR